MANRYWVGGTAAWDGTAGTKWALTSGGTGGEPIPTIADDVFFDSASGANTVTISAGNTGAKSIDCTGFTGTLAGNAAITVFGSITLVSGMTYTYTGTITFNATSTVISAGKTFAFLAVNAVSGTVTLGDAFNSTGNLNLTNGTLTATGNVTVFSFISTANNAGRIVNMGSGLWTLTGAGTIWNLQNQATITINKDTANILLSDTSTTSRTFTGLNKQYNKLTIGGATGISTTTISASNATEAFTEIASTKTVAHTILFSATNTRVGAWSVTGSAGNVVTVGNSVVSTATLTKTTSGHLTGIDYLNIRYLVASPVSDTWYIGANSQIENVASNYMPRGFFTTQRSDNAVVVLTDTTGSATWSVPSDWNSSNNAIHLIGGGGGGGNSNVSGNNRAAGGGGGGGGYTRLNNQSLTIGASIPYQAGAAGAIFSAGGTTSWNSGAATAGGGGGGASTITPTSTGGAGGIGSTYNGGAGGAGSTSTVAGTGNGGGGGGGAGGPNGAGRNGGNGFASTTAANISGGGGGGNGGGTNGGNGSAGVGGTGGNNSSGVGGGASDTPGILGGGGGGGKSSAGGSPGAGSNGIEIFSGAGSGGGSGGWGTIFDVTAPSGFYGAGAGGDAVATNGTISNLNTVGSQGAIIITYVPLSGTGNMFFMFS